MDRDFYAAGEQAPGVQGAVAKDWIPPAQWNVTEGRPYTDAEWVARTAPPPLAVEPDAPPPERGFTCRDCKNTFPTLKDVMDHRKTAHPKPEVASVG